MLILNLASARFHSGGKQTRTKTSSGGRRRTGLVPLSCRVFPTLYTFFRYLLFSMSYLLLAIFFLSWSATCTPWSGKASEEGYGYWNGIHQKTEQLRSQKRHSSNFSTYLKMKTVGQSGLAYPWPSGSEALRPATRWIPWIMPGLIVDYHGGKTGRHLTFRIFWARKNQYVPVQYPMFRPNGWNLVYSKVRWLWMVYFKTRTRCATTTNPNTLQAWKKRAAHYKSLLANPGSQKLLANLRWSGQSQIVKLAWASPFRIKRLPMLSSLSRCSEEYFKHPLEKRRFWTSLFQRLFRIDK